MDRRRTKGGPDRRRVRYIVVQVFWMVTFEQKAPVAWARQSQERKIRAQRP